MEHVCVATFSFSMAPLVMGEASTTCSLAENDPKARPAVPGFVDLSVTCTAQHGAQ